MLPENKITEDINCIDMVINQDGLDQNLCIKISENKQCFNDILASF